MKRPEAAIAAATGGYAYEPEAGIIACCSSRTWPRRRGSCLPARATRIICVPAADDDEERDVRSRALRLGRALGDEKRVEILRVSPPARRALNELADATGLAKSTVHHHVAVLRQAELVTLRGNARGYW